MKLMEERFENDDYSRYAAPDYRELGPRGYQRSDDRIYEEVCEALRDEPNVDATDISVTVRDRIVFLEGFAHNRMEKRIAEAVSEEIPGVLDVRNEIRLS